MVSVLCDGISVQALCVLQNSILAQLRTVVTAVLFSAEKLFDSRCQFEMIWLDTICYAS